MHVAYCLFATWLAFIVRKYKYAFRFWTSSLSIQIITTYTTIKFYKCSSEKKNGIVEYCQPSSTSRIIKKTKKKTQNKNKLIRRTNA